MDKDRWPRIKEIFLEALKRKPEEIDAFLEEACREQPDLRDEVLTLLSSHGQSQKFMEFPTEAGLFSDATEEQLADIKIGQYQIQRVISSGGMGTVYEALQENPRRTVAIKVMREGIASQSALRRFEYESQILASLRHANIAQVIEAGTHHEEGKEAKEGTPYFVMEYIPNARSITEYAQEKDLSISERLELFLPVCEAVHYGHLKGIIHRDLKPSNLLVDEAGKVKIIDFGVARATDADLSLTTARTDVGQLIGTVQYMSPEQCMADPAELDTRSDVYALGVVLYELLCEELPYDVRKAMVFEATRVIREDPPKKPSTTKRALRGDAETIVLKALEKQRARRYQSVADLSTDILRYLKGEVILAKPAGLAIRTWKQVKRHPILSTALGMALLAAFAFLGYILFVSYPQIKHQMRVAEQERLKAVQARIEVELEAENTQSINHFLEEMLSVSSPFYEGPDLTVPEMLDRAVEKIEDQFPDKPELEARLRYTIGWVYRHYGQYDDAANQLRAAAEIGKEVLGEEHPDTLRYIVSLAHVLDLLGDLSEADSMLRRALEIQYRVVDEEDPDKLLAMACLAYVLLKQGKASEAEPLVREALEIQRRTLGEQDRDTLYSMTCLTELLTSQGAYSEGEQLARKVLEIRRRSQGNEHPETLRSMNNLSVVLLNQGKFIDAESILREVNELERRVMGEEHPMTISSLNNLVNALMAQGRFAEAEPFASRVLELYRSVLGENHPRTITAMNNLCGALIRMGKVDEAERLQRKVIELRTQVLGEEHPETQSAMRNLAMTLLDLGQSSEAESLMREVIEIQNRVLGKEHLETLRSMNNMAYLLTEVGKPSEAESLFRKMIEIQNRKLGKEHPDTLRAMKNLAYVLSKQDGGSEAEVLYREVLEIKRRVLGADHPDIPVATKNLARQLERQGDISEAAALYEESLETARKTLFYGRDTTNYFLCYGRCLTKLARYDEAEKLLEEGYGILLDKWGEEDEDTKLNVTALIELYEAWDKPDQTTAWREKLN
ncbi:MAG: tetratricopeptide repeat protein [Planctomycetota bacterium]|jgi:serine/threonine protein kinase/tetratricopeptide (TPR) repeat protein